jgi:hypothetical protein
MSVGGSQLIGESDEANYWNHPFRGRPRGSWRGLLRRECWYYTQGQLWVLPYELEGSRIRLLC